jgi:orotate phosphoribosyltransferase
MKEVKDEFLATLITKGAIRISDNINKMFEFKSGRKSPNFINLRVLTDGESLNVIKRSYSNFIFSLIKEKKIEDFDFIFGPAYAGINIACLACEGLNEIHKMNKRYMFDRKEVKNYADKDMDSVIVGGGFFKPGAKILIVDDVITTGKTKMGSIKKLDFLGDYKIVGMVIAADRQERMGDAVNVEKESAVENMENNYGIKTFSILNMKEIFEAIKDDLPADIKHAWIEYYEKYGTVKLIN